MAPPPDRANTREGRSGHDRWHHCKPQLALQASRKVGTPEDSQTAAGESGRAMASLGGSRALVLQGAACGSECHRGLEGLFNPASTGNVEIEVARLKYN